MCTPVYITKHPNQRENKWLIVWKKLNSLSYNLIPNLIMLAFKCLNCCYPIKSKIKTRIIMKCQE